MRELQLEAKTPEEERVKAYLNENASETLREKSKTEPYTKKTVIP